MSECRVGRLLEEVAAIKQPPVFQATLTSSSRASGLCAVGYLREGNDPHLEEVTVWGDTPEEALERLLKELEEKYGPCPHCGRYGWQKA
jgi:hypothetical protein